MLAPESVGAENTFSTDLTEFDAMLAELQPLIDKVWRHCEDKGARGRTVTLKVKFADFETISRSRSVPVVVSSRDDVECHSDCNIDPPYCLTCECYPDGAIAADDPMSADRARQLAFPACSTRGAVGGSGPT
jgi:nucleotidyltransferase/DNA polymerase involved in DNA repair